MIRDTFFSASRFVNLCRKEMVESWKTNLLRFIMMYGIMAIIFVWGGYWKYNHPERLLSKGELADPMWSTELIVFLWAVVIMGMLSASFIMERMKSKTNRIAVLMTPATMFERYFSRWLVFTFGFLIVFLIAFKMADWTRVAVYLVSYPELKDIISSTPLSHLVGTEQYWAAFRSCDGLLLGISIYFFTHSLFILGSTIWPKNAFVKTFSAIIAVIVIYTLVGSTLAYQLFEGRGPRGVNSSLSDDVLAHWLTVAFFVMALFNWIVAYFRFKESEIINRW